MEIVLTVLGVWLLASLAVALFVGRLLRVADRRERATNVTGSGLPRATHEATHRTGSAEVHETA